VKNPKKPYKIPTALLARFREFVSLQLGLDFPEERRVDLERGIAAVAKELSCPDPASCIEMFLTTPLSRNHAEILASNLTIGETYFFRDKISFNILEKSVLPDLIMTRREQRRINIWSAGCATGEEPYSLAILLDRLIRDREHWQIQILGTDINTRFLEQAVHGVYGAWSFRDTPAWVKDKCFRKKGDKNFEILPHLRGMVTFAHHNLSEDVYPVALPPALDLILCRNVLMYFAGDRAVKAIRNFNRRLGEGGWLHMSPCDMSSTAAEGFSVTLFPGTAFYRKLAHQGQAPSDDSSGHLFARLPREEAELDGPMASATGPETQALPPGQPPVPDEREGAGAARGATDDYAEANSLFEQRSYSLAESKLLDLLASAPEDAPAMALLARVYANLGRLCEAGAWSERAINADKLNPAHHYLLATILEEQERRDGAATHLKRALYLAPDFVIAYFALGNLARREGKKREAERCFRNALALLAKYGRDEIVAGSEGLAAGRMSDIIQTLLLSGKG